MWKANNLQRHQIVSIVKIWQFICLKKCQNVRHATTIISKHVVECHQDETCGNYLNVGTYGHEEYTHLKNYYSHTTQDLATQLTKHEPHCNTQRSHTLLTALSKESGSLTLKHRRNTLASWYARGRTLSYAPVPGTPTQKTITLSVHHIILEPGQAAERNQLCPPMHSMHHETNFLLQLSKGGSTL
jgi:hypothetical protein